MKIKTFLYLTIVLATLAFNACSDDTTPIGNAIQPPGDVVFVGTDSVTLSARTVPMGPIYARTANGSLGEIEDPLFGKMKSDYLCELYTSKQYGFFDKIVAVDSVQVVLSFNRKLCVGDSLNPIGVTAYQVTKKLDRDYYTNINPKDYCDLSTVLGKGIFTTKSAPLREGYSIFRLNADTLIGKKFIQKYKDDPKTFADSEAFKKFFPGIYTTTTFGSGTMISVAYTTFEIYYKYTGRNAADDGDSTRLSSFVLSTQTSAPEVVQMYHVDNQSPADLLDAAGVPNLVKTYLSSPGGLCTEVTIPLQQIIDKAGKGRTINSSTFSLMGLTEEESSSKLASPPYLLLVNKDSVQNFISGKRTEDHVTSFLMKRATNNTYDFINATSSFNPNLASLVNHYIAQNKDKAIVPDLTYLIIPVQRKEELVQSSYYRTAALYNEMMPTRAILRTDPDRMKMKLVFSEYAK